MTVLLLATRNPGKVRELEPLLHEAGLAVVLETLADHPELATVEETGTTFEENARLKACTCARAVGRWALGEDSGIEVDALDGAPGVRSARYAGPHGDDRANNERVLRELGSTPCRRARYVAVVVLSDPVGRAVASARGTCEGAIADRPRGSGGFGYDPLFLPEGETRTMAELSASEKAAISHRGRAIREILPALRQCLAGSKSRRPGCDSGYTGG